MNCHSEEEQPDFRAYVFPTARKWGVLATTKNVGAGTVDTSIRFLRVSVKDVNTAIYFHNRCNKCPSQVTRLRC